MSDQRDRNTQTSLNTASPKRFGRFPITITLAVSIGLLVGVAVFSVLFLGFNSGRKNTLGLLNQNAVLMMDTIETGVRNHLDPAVDQLNHIEHLFDIDMASPDDLPALLPILAGSIAAASQVTAVAFWDRDLQSAVALRPPDEPVATQIRDDSDNRDIQELLKQVQQSGELFWGELVHDEISKVTFVNAVMPVEIGGEFVGFLGIGVTVPELSRLMEQVGEQFNATAYIMYGEDRILAHPFLVTGHQEQSRENPAVNIDHLGDLLLANLETSYPVIGFDEAAQRGVQVEGVDLFGQTHVIFSREIQDYGSTLWILGAHVPVDLINTEIRRLIGSAVAGLFVFLLSIVAAIFLGRAIARPIKRTARGAAQVASFELSEIQPIAASFIRELNDQANAFNTMLAGLKWFESYVPKSLVKRLIQTGELQHIESQELTLTVMFTDIVGFTPMSESMTAPAIAELLNHHFSLIGRCVLDEGGTIDKYIGDSLMAFWGAPDHQDDHAVRAVRAAAAIRKVLAEDNQERKKEWPPVRIRIGLHTGPVTVGNIGSEDRINYTIVGDTVNTGQRIEALGKDLTDTGEDVIVLLSATTAHALDDDHYQIENIGEFQLKGRRDKVGVFQLR